MSERASMGSRADQLAKEKETAAQRSPVVVTNPPTKKTTIAKTDSEPTQQPQQEADTRPAGILQRRNSFQKQREQWVVSDAIKSPSPTPPASSQSFVAKKSRPQETCRSCQIRSEACILLRKSIHFGLHTTNS